MNVTKQQIVNGATRYIKEDNFGLKQNAREAVESV